MRCINQVNMQLAFMPGGNKKKAKLTLGAVKTGLWTWPDGTFKLASVKKNSALSHVVEHVIRIPHKCHILFL